MYGNLHDALNQPYVNDISRGLEVTGGAHHQSEPEYDLQNNKELIEDDLIITSGMSTCYVYSHRTTTRHNRQEEVCQIQIHH